MEESRVLVLMNRIVFATHRYGLALCGVSSDALTHDCPERNEFVHRCEDVVDYPKCNDLILKGVFPTEVLFTVALKEGKITQPEMDRFLSMREYAIRFLNQYKLRNDGCDIQCLSENTLVEWESLINTIVQ